MPSEQELLRWGIEHTTDGSIKPLTEEIQQGKRPDLNPEMLHAIMGESDADKMRKCMLLINYEGDDVDREEKLIAWENLELLVQDLDNANDLQSTQLWPQILPHFTNADSEFATMALWVAGTAVQNNPKSQQAFLDYSPMGTLVSILGDTKLPLDTRTKALYCLSSALKWCPAAVEAFNKVDGAWSTLSQLMFDHLDGPVAGRIAFLIGQLAMQGAVQINVLRDNSLLDCLIKMVPVSEEKALFALYNIGSTKAYPLQTSEKQAIKNTLTGSAEHYSDVLGITQAEWNSFVGGL